jgi:pathogenesis-related protein 1
MRRDSSSIVILLWAVTAAAPASAELTPAQQAEMVAAHNAVRADVDPPAVPPLATVSWSSSLGSSAQSWADQCTYSHSGSGENIFAATYQPTMQGVVESWASEEDLYDYWANNWWPAAGHYSQIIWRSSTSIGCGMKYCSGAAYPWYVVCQYSPSGNYSGQYPYLCDYGWGWDVCQESDDEIFEDGFESGDVTEWE